MLIFQSTLPGWGATGRDSHDAYIASISIHAPRMGSDGTLTDVRGFGIISIHAPRMGSDIATGVRG